MFQSLNLYLKSHSFNNVTVKFFACSMNFNLHVSAQTTIFNSEIVNAVHFLSFSINSFTPSRYQEAGM